jgi:hypothetical protein
LGNLIKHLLCQTEKIQRTKILALQSDGNTRNVMGKSFNVKRMKIKEEKNEKMRDLLGLGQRTAHWYRAEKRK